MTLIAQPLREKISKWGIMKLKKFLERNLREEPVYLTARIYKQNSNLNKKTIALCKHGM